jgi:hypothetical protein
VFFIRSGMYLDDEFRHRGPHVGLVVTVLVALAITAIALCLSR